jgi:chloramphenicol 3-O-phosphotransferase
VNRLFLINGAMGVGKTAVSRELQRLLPRCVFLDGDWCWDTRPFLVTEATKAAVQDNIVFCLNRFLACPDYENGVFCWVMHQMPILTELLSRLQPGGCSIYTVTLICSPEALTARLQEDINAGRRLPDVLERSLSRLPLYRDMPTLHINTSFCTAAEAAKEILRKCL